VESLRVLTANYPAEYGRKLGGVIEVSTETIWYALYGTVLWVAVAVVLSTSGRQQRSRRKRFALDRKEA
jgi:ABC-type Fe3+ transport system permease subunit